MRLPYAPSSPTSPSDADIYARIAARRAPGPLTALDLALLHAPAVADGWNAFLGAVRTQTTLPAAVLELAVCRVAALNGAAYEWAHHAPLARGAGLSAQALDVVREVGGGRGERGEEGGGKTEVEKGKGATGRGEEGEGESEVEEKEEEGGGGGGGLGAREWAVLAYTDQMTRSVAVAESTFARLRGFFGEREIVELTAVVASYNCVSRFLVALDVGEMNGKRMESGGVAGWDGR